MCIHFTECEIQDACLTSIFTIKNMKTIRDNLHDGHFSCPRSTILPYVKPNRQSVRQLIQKEALESRAALLSKPKKREKLIRRLFKLHANLQTANNDNCTSYDSLQTRATWINKAETALLKGCTTILITHDNRNLLTKTLTMIQACVFVSQQKFGLSHAL